WLPVEVHTRSDRGGGPVWEDRHRLLLVAGSRFPGAAPGMIIRLDIRTGAVERVTLPTGRGGCTPIVPLPRADPGGADPSCTHAGRCPPRTRCSDISTPCPTGDGGAATTNAAP